MCFNKIFKKILICGTSLLMLTSISSYTSVLAHTHHYHYHYIRISHHRTNEYHKAKRYMNYIRWYDEHHYHKLSISQEANYIDHKCRSLKYLSNHQRHWIINSIADINDTNYKKKVSHATNKPLLTRSQRAKISKIRHDYNYLLTNENNTNTNDATYRKEKIDWINFYRHDIYHENPVEENSQYDSIAQNDVLKGQDPEDWQNSDTPQDVDNYFTDQYDDDNDNEATHRNSVTNPYADEIGVGRDGQGNSGIYFNWGLDNGAGDDFPVDDMFPASNLFPINDAKKGIYWSYEFYDNPYDDGNAVSKPRISVYDNNTQNYLPISNEHTTSSIIYYNVNPNRLYLNHTYTINIHGHRYDSIRYKTTLFNL